MRQIVVAAVNRELVDLGLDHYARLTAVDRLIKVLTAGRPVPKAAELT